jgi:hypothetical protein
MHTPKRFTEAAGLWVGSLIAPIFAFGSLLRQARIFHPQGINFRADVRAIEGQEIDPRFTELVQGLTKGDALVRFSTGMWSVDMMRLPDVLGMSIRFRADRDNNFGPEEGAQDLLLVTSESLAQLPVAALATNQYNFAGNAYHGMAPFAVAEQQDMILRVVPTTHINVSGTDRYQNIRTSVDEEDVVFRLETASQFQPMKWLPLVEIRLMAEVSIDDTKLEFYPFRTGQNIIPQGFIQYMRPVPYLLSQYARQA